MYASSRRILKEIQMSIESPEKAKRTAAHEWKEGSIHLSTCCVPRKNLIFLDESNPTYKWVMQHSTNIFVAVQFEKKDQISSSSYRIEIDTENPFVPQLPTCLPTFKFHEYVISAVCQKSLISTM